MPPQTIDRKTLAALPPLFRIKAAFLTAGFLSLVLSVVLWFSGMRDEGLFVGLWVPAIHSLGALVLSGEKLDTGSAA